MNAPSHLAFGRDTAALQIGEWLLEPARNRLSRGATAARLEPKAIEVLTYLAFRPGQVVSREELMAAVWPGVVVGDESLTQAMIKLRRALGDQPRQPMYVETISKRGYRLIAPVRAVSAPDLGDRNAPAPSPITPPVADDTSRRQLRRAGWIVLALAATGLGVALLWQVQSRHASDPNVSAAVEPAHIDTHPTVAVAPFRVTGEAEPETLVAAGIAADLVSDLSKISGLRVIRLPTGNTQATPAPAARYVVTGDVQRADDRLRVWVHLAERESGRTLWTERYERPLTDLFALQDELTRQILGVLPVKVTEAEARRAAQRYTKNLEAYQLFQAGQLASALRREADGRAARELYLKALQLDPTFARAYAAMAVSHARDHRYGFGQAGPAELDRALDLAKTARQIDAELPEVYFALAYVEAHRREHAAALEHVETALRLNPSYADAYGLKAHINLDVGRLAQAIPLVRTAMRLTQESSQFYLLLLGRAYFFLNDFEQARINLRAAVSRNIADVEAHVYLAATLAYAGDTDGAAWEAEEIRGLLPSFRAATWLETYPMTDAAQRDRLAAALAKLGL